MYTCNCGRTFPGTLDGAWAAREHAEAHGHRLRVRRETPPARRAPTLGRSLA